MAGLWGPAAAGLALLGILSTTLAANAAPVPAGAGEEWADRSRSEPVPEAMTEAVRRALRGVVIADQNRDGIISAREATRFYQARFGVMDLDGDRILSWPEFVDGQLPVAERAAARRNVGWQRTTRFESMDLDGNEKLDREEFALALLLDRRSKDATPRHERRRDAFELFDGDGDGMLSEREFVIAGERHFAESDADGDGRVTIWEFMSRLRF